MATRSIRVIFEFLPREVATMNRAPRALRSGLLCAAIFLLTGMCESEPVADSLSLTEKLAYTTVRIEVISDRGRGTGTGFFFLLLQHDSISVPVIVTNKHVVHGAVRGSFILTGANPDGTPNSHLVRAIHLDGFEALWTPHPDTLIDLAVMPIARLLRQARAEGFRPFFTSLGKGTIPSEDQLSQLTAVEEILMVGYPTGIWDRVNNCPVFRRGITATHPANKYEGRDEFMIDAACFPGSSGSPVFLYNLGSYEGRNGGTVMGTRFFFLGVLYAGPQYTATGEIRILTIPERRDTVTTTSIPLNLGNVIRSSRILDFEPVFSAPNEGDH